MPRSTGGRAARLEARTGAGSGPTAPAFVRRRIPVYELVGEEGLDLIEARADDLLAEIGIEVHDDIALRLFADAGATVTGQRVRFDRGHVRSLCATAPATFTQLARNPAHSVEIGGDNVVLAPAYGSPFVRDLAGGRRYGTLADFENFVKLACMTPVAAPLRRHGVRARRRAGQQAPPRHGVRPPALQRQGVHGLGHPPERAARLDRDGPHRLRRRRRRQELRHPRQRQRQLAVGLGRRDDRRDPQPMPPPTRRPSSCRSSSAARWAR